MKTVPPPLPPAATGREYWRSLDQLTENPEFRRWLESEFPADFAEAGDAVSRRHFVKIMAASFLLAGVGLTGCRKPEEYIYPFAKMPEDYIHGLPRYYATAMPTRGGAVPLLVKSNDGRPTKIEGNPRHPQGRGGTDVFAQASILDLYDPDRAARILHQTAEETPAAARDFLAALAKEATARQGQGLCLLSERVHSPTRRRLQAVLREKMPLARWFVYEPVDFDIHRRAATLVGGRPVRPYYRFDRAQVIVSLDGDFLGAEEESGRHIGDFAKGRRMSGPQAALNRLYVIEGLMTLTGAGADHRLRAATGSILTAVARLAKAVLSQLGAGAITPQVQGFLGALEPLSRAYQGDPRWITECANDLVKHDGGRSLVVAGYRQPLAVHVMAQVLNQVLGSNGATVVYQETPEPFEAPLPELAAALEAGQVDTLVILGGNPVYNAPANLRWAQSQRQAKTVVRWGYYEDETTALSDWQIPAAHYLESWGDARTSDGTLVSIQPLIDPLLGGWTELEVLASLGGLAPADPYALVRETVRQQVKGEDFEAHWKQFLRDGFLAGSAAPTVSVDCAWDAATRALDGVVPPARGPDGNQLEVVFYRDYCLDDGRYSNNGWLQELPDPITKLTWDNAVLVSPKTAGVLALDEERLVEVRLGERRVQGPVWIQPGQADFTIACALGYGRARTGRVGAGAGFNVYPLRTTEAEHYAAGATLTKLAGKAALACTQNHGSLNGRPIVREANLDRYRTRGDFAQKMDLEAHSPNAGPIYPHPFTANPVLKGPQQWGMAIDLNTCIGCSACVVACQSENNIPIVGKDQVRRGREMHWLRSDRYYSTAPNDRERAEPQVVFQLMLCQHCENAPCEYVCPVNATVHDEQGLNVMVYNRCVGTRYCSNNCPYKVRHFNYFDFNQRPLDKLYLGPLAPKGTPELVQMAKNPDVTVRMRGVMEKCSYCIQRIEQAKIAQKIKAGASKNVLVPDGAITPACAQACPAEAIVFGDMADPATRVAKLKQQERNYAVLGFLNTVPHTTYLARIRNPNPLMPDYHAQPFSFEEYVRQTGDQPESNPPAQGGDAKETPGPKGGS